MFINKLYFSANCSSRLRSSWAIKLSAIGLNLATLFFELTTTHPTVDAGRVSNMITKGQYAKMFYGGTVLVGNIIPVVLLIMSAGNPMMMAAAGVLVLVGIYFTEHIWVEAPQRIPLT